MGMTSERAKGVLKALRYLMGYRCKHCGQKIEYAIWEHRVPGYGIHYTIAITCKCGRTEHHGKDMP